MIATAAESNLSCFRPGPMADAASELVPSYARLVSDNDSHYWTGRLNSSYIARPTSSATAGAILSIVSLNSSHHLPSLVSLLLAERKDLLDPHGI